jgi:hypothetical protein
MYDPFVASYEAAIAQRGTESAVAHMNAGVHPLSTRYACQITMTLTVRQGGAASMKFSQ